MANVKVLEKGKRASLVSALAIAFIAVLKGWVGLASGSIALLADAVHSFSDIFSSLAVWFGLFLSQKKPTEKFPYGYYKGETFASLIVSLVIIASGIGIMKESIERFFSPTPTSMHSIAILVAVFSAIVSYLLAGYKERVGKEINSQALISDGRHSLVDVGATLLVVVGVSASYLGYPLIEPLVGVVIALLILRLGIEGGKNAVLVLMDVRVKPELFSRIEGELKKAKGIIGVHELKIRRSGPFIFGEAHIEVEEGIPVEKANRIAEDAEGMIKKRFPQVDSLLLHVEPAKKKEFRVAVPVEDTNGLDSKPSSHLGRAAYFLIADVKENKIIGWKIHENPGARAEKKRGVLASNLLRDKKVDVVLLNEIGEAPYHILKDSYISIYSFPPCGKAREAIALWMEESLKRFILK